MSLRAPILFTALCLLLAGTSLPAADEARVISEGFVSFTPGDSLMRPLAKFPPVEIRRYVRAESSGAASTLYKQSCVLHTPPLKPKQWLAVAAFADGAPLLSFALLSINTTTEKEGQLSRVFTSGPMTRGKISLPDFLWLESKPADVPVALRKSVKEGLVFAVPSASFHEDMPLLELHWESGEPRHLTLSWAILEAPLKPTAEAVRKALELPSARP